MNNAETQLFLKLSREGIYGGEEAGGDWTLRYPRISEMTGAIQLYEGGRWMGGDEPDKTAEAAWPELKSPDVNPLDWLAERERLSALWRG